MEPAELLAELLTQFGDKIALASSFGAEDQVLTDMLCKITRSCHIFTLDTGRLNQETYDTMEATRKKFGVTVTVLFPDRQQVETMVNEHGPNLIADAHGSGFDATSHDTAIIIIICKPINILDRKTQWLIIP